MTERRQNLPSTDLDDLLQQLPARVILDRMHSPVISIDHDGVLAYANPAFATMLGYDGVAALVGKSLPSILARYSHTTPTECIALLKDAGKKVIEWCDADGFPVHTSVSEPLLLRASDPFLMLSVTDVTELIWR